jgi:hypothetical protein
LPAQHRAVTKLLILLLFGGALANSLASAREEPPLLIDSQPAPASLDANN